MPFPQSLRWTLRGLRNTPRFTWLAILMLSLALGAHLAMVAVIDTVLLRPVPVLEPDTLVAIHETRNGVGFSSLAFADYLDYRAYSKAFDDLAVHYSTAPLHLDFGGDGEIVNGAIVSANYFSLLGVEPGRGRYFQLSEDASPGSHPVAVISDGMWRRRFGGRDDVLGSVVEVNGADLTVVGVTPPGFVGLDAGRPCDLWIPTMMASVGNTWCDSLNQRTCRTFEMVGRLAGSQTPQTAQAELNVLSQNVHSAHPLPGDTVRGLHVTPVSGLASERGQSSRRMIVLLMIVVTLIVAVACANLSGLLIGRGLIRRRDIAIRLALGASRRRVVIMFIAEALVLTSAGAVGGLLLAALATPLGALVFQTHVPIEVEISPAVVGYAALLSGLTAVLVGLVPGIQASMPTWVTNLKGTFAASKPRWLSGFVIAQIGISFVLLYSTGLFTRSLLAITEAPNIQPERIATLRLQPRFIGYEPEKRDTLVREVQRRIEALPGVQSVGFGKLRPLWPGFETPVSLPGGDSNPGESTFRAGLQPVSPETLATMGLPMLSGRDFDSGDKAGAPPVLIVNETLALQLWPAGDAVGQHLVLNETDYEVVGIVRDSPYRRLIHGRTAQAFSSFWQDPQSPDARFVVRFESRASVYLPTLRRLVSKVDPAVPVTEVGTLEERLRFEHSSIHLVSRLTAIAGLLAVLLSAVGLTSVLSLLVTQKLREVAIRRALGATHVQIVALVLRGAMLLVGIAVGSGLLASMIIAPALGDLLLGIDARDPGTLVATALLMSLVAAAAIWWPARQAVRINPILALRQ